VKRLKSPNHFHPPSRGPFPKQAFSKEFHEDTIHNLVFCRIPPILTSSPMMAADRSVECVILRDVYFTKVSWNSEAASSEEYCELVTGYSELARGFGGLITGCNVPSVSH